MKSDRNKSTFYITTFDGIHEDMILFKLDTFGVILIWTAFLVSGTTGRLRMWIPVFGIPLGLISLTSSSFLDNLAVLNFTFHFFKLDLLQFISIVVLLYLILNF